MCIDFARKIFLSFVSSSLFPLNICSSFPSSQLFATIWNCQCVSYKRHKVNKTKKRLIIFLPFQDRWQSTFFWKLSLLSDNNFRSPLSSWWWWWWFEFEDLISPSSFSSPFDKSFLSSSLNLVIFHFSLFSLFFMDRAKTTTHNANGGGEPSSHHHMEKAENMFYAKAEHRHESLYSLLYHPISTAFARARRRFVLSPRMPKHDECRLDDRVELSVGAHIPLPRTHIDERKCERGRENECFGQNYVAYVAGERESQPTPLAHRENFFSSITNIYCESFSFLTSTLPPTCWLCCRNIHDSHSFLCLFSRLSFFTMICFSGHT